MTTKQKMHAILPNQFWKSKAPHGRELRVMALAEGWVMVRHKGCGPFLLTERDLKADFQLDSNPFRSGQKQGEKS